MPVNSFENYYMSWKPSLEAAAGPLYITLAGQLEAAIKSGSLKPGTKLPPQRELADFLDINLSTVTRAFKICTQKGLISATIGNGTYVSSDVPFDGMFLHTPAGSRLIEMGAILPSSAPNTVILTQTANLLKRKSENLLQYSIPGGNDLHRGVAAKWLSFGNFHPDSESILMSSGGQNAIMATMAGLFNAGDKLGCDEITYPGIKSVAKLLGIQLIPIKGIVSRIADTLRTDNYYELVESSLEYACRIDGIKGMYLISDLQNPSTLSLSVESRKMIADYARKYNLIILEDSINTRYLEDRPEPISYYAPDNTVYIASLSKTLAPGIRMAYLSVPSTLRDTISQALYSTNISVSALLLQITTELVQSGAALEVVNERKELIKRRSAVFDNVFSGFRYFGDTLCPFRFLIIPSEWECTVFEKAAKAANVQLYAADRFAAGNAAYPNGVRLSLISEEKEESFLKGLQTLKSILTGSREREPFW